MNPIKSVLAKHAKNAKGKQPVGNFRIEGDDAAQSQYELLFLGALGVLGEKQLRFSE